jgi:hypothetical protein
MASVPFQVASSGNTCSGALLAPKKKCSFAMEFAPSMASVSSNGSIDVVYNGASPSINLVGDAIPVTLKAPTTVSFPPAAPATTGASKPIRILNSAAATVSFDNSAALGGDNPGSFRITSNECSGHPLGKGSCTVMIQFAPGASASGTQSATLSLLFSYGPNQGTVEINKLSGTVK